MEPPLVEHSREHMHKWIDINKTIMRELVCFPRLYFLKRAFNDYFKQTRKTLRLIVHTRTDNYEWDISVVEYLMKLAAHRGFRVWDVHDKLSEDEKSSLGED